MTTFVKIGRIHLILPLGLMVIGPILMFEALSAGATGQPSWFFQKSYHELEWFWGLCALFVGTIWIGGRVGWWLVRTIIQWWIREVWKQSQRPVT
jgi:uncharacterized membrane protein YfcA